MACFSKARSCTTWHCYTGYWQTQQLWRESLLEVKEDGECEPWGFEMQTDIPLDASTAGFVLIRCVLGFLFSQMWPKLLVPQKCMLQSWEHAVSCKGWGDTCILLSITHWALHALLQLFFLTKLESSILENFSSVLSPYFGNKVFLLLSKTVSCGVTRIWSFVKSKLFIVLPDVPWSELRYCPAQVAAE